MLHVIFSKWYFCPFCFHAHKYIRIFCFFFSFPRTLVQLLLFRFDLSAFGHWSICVSGVCACAPFFQFHSSFPIVFWCAFGWTGVKRILFVRRLHGLAFFVCVVVCWPTFWEWQQSTTSIMHTKSSVNSFWNKKSIGNFVDFLCVAYTKQCNMHICIDGIGVECVHHPFEMQTSYVCAYLWNIWAENKTVTFIENAIP